MEVLTYSIRSVSILLLQSRRAVLLLSILMALFCAPGSEVRGQTREYQLKAAFLFNFAQFTDFPTNAFESPTSSMVIAVLGENPFGDTLEELVAGETIANHPVKVRHCRTLEELEGAHVVFIARSAWSMIPEVLKQVAGKPVLTVSEMELFASRGGMIRLFAAANRIQFNVNPAESQRAGLKFSSKLLRLATVIREEPPE